MPLPLPADTTPRIVVSYTSGALAHSMLMRAPISALGADHRQMVIDLCTALAPYMHPSNAWDSAEYIVAGSSFGVPIAWTPIPGTWAGSAYVEDPESAFCSVTARSLGGHRTRWELFTVAALFSPWPLTNRVAAGVSATADAIVAAFATACVDLSAPLSAVDGQATVCHTYLNVAKNAHTQRAQR